MADHHLDDDSSKWPNDPFALLGVPNDADERTVRRAYLRLIKLFKPEQKPDEFQKIRQAFESITSINELRGALQNSLESGTQIEVQLDSGKALFSVAPRVEIPAPDKHSTSDQSDIAIWDELCQTGDDSSAYRKLLRLEELSSGDPRLCVKLYWLLHLHPELDPQRHRCKWLTRGLSQSGAAGRLALQLYGQEIERDPYEARSLRCSEALATSLPIDHRAALLNERWRACARTGDRSTIVSDIDQYRDEFAIDHQDQWAPLLTGAIRQFAAPLDEASSAMSGSAKRWELIKRWTDEVDSLSRHAAESVGDEIEFLTLLAKEWDQLQDNVAYQINAGWLELIAASASTSEAEQSLVFRRVVPQFFADPFSVLMTLDSMYESVPLATILSGRALLTFCERYPRPERELTQDETKEIGQRLHKECRGIEHFFIRRNLLDFCLVECISLTTLATIAATYLIRPSIDFTWTELINRDLGLQVAYATGRFVLG